MLAGPCERLSVVFCVSQKSDEEVAKKVRFAFHTSADVVEKPRPMSWAAVKPLSVPLQSPDVESDTAFPVRESGELKVSGNS